ncbi:protein jagunal-like protein [Leptotrombidium deliense]|uniref:Protein jagunal-like protein n=1 Tax=Leptotrombidium deliense TaxID=299467 RepID=A0A443S011_9ACAR|nr:protein jagunal-like protein [Leptotrombidium deliense]
MASKGQFVEGTDGNDYLHRQTVATHYQISALNKTRLKFCLVMHFLMFTLMMSKLMDDILDRFDIFVLQLQELYIPKPRLWEWIWSASVVFILIARKAIRKNNRTSMKFYVVATTLLALLPVLYSLGYYFNDVWEFIDSRDVTKVTEVWQGYPVGVLWYFFLLVSLQIHIFELYFAIKLIRAWSLKRSKKE